MQEERLTNFMKLNAQEIEAVIKAKHRVKLTAADKKALAEIVKKCESKKVDWNRLAPYIAVALGLGDKFDKFKDLFSG